MYFVDANKILSATVPGRVHCNRNRFKKDEQRFYAHALMIPLMLSLILPAT